MQSEVYKRKMDTPDELLARILDAPGCIKIREDNWDEQHTIFARELQSALKLTVRSSNIYFVKLTVISLSLLLFPVHLYL